MTKPPTFSVGSLKAPPRHLLAIDPGKDTGWAAFLDGLPAKFDIIRGLDAFDDFLSNYVHTYGMPDLVVYESYLLFKHKAVQQSGSKMEASQVIGKIEFWAKMLRIPVVKQPSSILPIAVKWSKLKMPSDHKNSHHISAYNHGWYYLVSNGMQLPTGI